MSEAGALEATFRSAAGRIVAVLAARFRDLDIAEEAFGEACEAAVRHWPANGSPNDPGAWLYRVAMRKALDRLRRSAVRNRAIVAMPDAYDPPAIDDEALIPDERLRLIFLCCHPALSGDGRAALTLRLVCGLSARDIAAAFLVPEATMLQRLTRAKRKIVAAGIPFEVPGPALWPERLEAVLTTLEVAYAKAHADAAGAGPHAGFAREILTLTETLAVLMPEDGEVLGLAALVRYAEARRPARVDADGMMVPISEQDPALWRRPLIDDGDHFLFRARNAGGFGPRALMAAIHGVWCARRDRAAPPPWKTVLALYDALLIQKDDPIVRLNRAVALAEVAGPIEALDAVEALGPSLDGFQPWHAARADLLGRVGRYGESRREYMRAIGLSDGPAERAWLERKSRSMQAGSS